jgi:hypothetical protein
MVSNPLFGDSECPGRDTPLDLRAGTDDTRATSDIPPERGRTEVERHRRNPSVPDHPNQSLTAHEPLLARAGTSQCEAHLLFKCEQVELHQIGKPALEHEAGDAAGELHRLMGVAAEADGQLTRPAIDPARSSASASMSASWSRNRRCLMPK